MSTRPHLTVATIIQIDNLFLMVEEHKLGQLVLNQPAGHVENDESLIEAAKREALEETGHDVHLDSFLGFYRYQAPNGVNYCRATFIAHSAKKITEQLDSDITACHWLSIDQIKQRPHRSHLVLDNIKDYLDGKRFDLSIVNE